MQDGILWIVLVVVLLAPFSSSARGGDRLTGLAFVTRSEVIARHGMGATSPPLATQVACYIL